MFDFAGGRHRTVEQQLALEQSQQQELQAAALAVSGNVAMQALAIASAQAQLEALEAVLADDQRNLQLVQDAFDAGSATRVDVLNAQSQLANDQTLLPPLRRQRALAQHALALLVGSTPASFTAPDFTLERISSARGTAARACLPSSRTDGPTSRPRRRSCMRLAPPSALRRRTSIPRSA